MYTIPPLEASGSTNTAVGASSAAVIAAPPAGQALRIAWISIAYGRSSVGLTNVSFAIGAAHLFESTLSGTGSTRWADGIVFPEPGAANTVATALTILLNGTIAGEGVRWAIGYLVDNVT